MPLGFCFPCIVTLLLPTMVNRWFAVKVGAIMSAIGIVESFSDIIFNTIGSFLIANYSWRAREFIGIMGVAFFAVRGASPIWIAIFTGIAGVNSSVGTMAFPIMTREIFGTKEYPSIWAQIARWMSWLGALNSVIWGTVVDISGTYLAAFYISSFVGLLPVIFLLLADKKGKQLQTRWSS